jgi:NitT/TauT family transport system permease protein
MPRQDFIRETLASAAVAIVEIPRSPWQRLANSPAARKIFVLVVLALAWEGYARWLDNPLLFPTLGATVEALWNGFASGELEARSWVSLSVLLIGYGAGVALAFTLAVIAITWRLGNDFL